MFGQCELTSIGNEPKSSLLFAKKNLKKKHYNLTAQCYRIK